MTRLRHRLKAIPPIDRVNAAIKARRQERFAAREQRRYEAKARRLGIRVPGVDEVGRRLRRRLAARRGGRPVPDRGELHVFLAFYVTSWESILPAVLEPFGQVTAFEWRSRGFDDTAPGWLARRDEMNRAMLDTFDEAHGRRPVDAVVGYLSGHNTSPEVLERMAASGAAIFNFCWDDKLHYAGPLRGGRRVGPAAIARAVDLNLTNAPSSIVKYVADGALAIFWPEAAHPRVHRPHDVPFEFDVSFVGGRYGWRPRFIEQLRTRGVAVECFGPRWPNGPLSDEEMVRLYSRSRINLGFGGIGHSRRLTCLKGRDFEVPMSGGLYMTTHNPELELVYDVGREIVTCHHAGDCARTIRELLADPDRAAAIRAAGRRRALRDHTYEARWTEAFTLAGLVAGPGA